MGKQVPWEVRQNSKERCYVLVRLIQMFYTPSSKRKVLHGDGALGACQT